MDVLTIQCAPGFAKFCTRERPRDMAPGGARLRKQQLRHAARVATKKLLAELALELDQEPAPQIPGVCYVREEKPVVLHYGLRHLLCTK